MRTKRRQLALLKVSDEDNKAIIPGIPDDISLLCLARLPSRLQTQVCCVSPCWKRAIESQVLFSLRLQLRTLETQFLLSFNYPCSRNPRNTFSWWVIDPLCIRYFPIDLPCLSLHDPVQPIASASPHEVLFLSENGDELSRVDLFRRRSLRPSAPLMVTNRQHFASASLDGHVYAAGGYIPNSAPVEPGRFMLFTETALKCFERLDCTHMSTWESLPDMKVARAHAEAVAMNGKLYVIGGRNRRERVYSGEIWDPEKQEWSLVPELWPRDVFDTTSAKGKVAVVMGRLLAIQEWTHEVVVYEQSSKTWASLGYLPFEMLSKVVVHLTFSCMLLGVGEELWVVVQRNSFKDGIWRTDHRMFSLEETCILACTPFSEPVRWRRLPYCFDAPYILWCAVQVTI